MMAFVDDRLKASLSLSLSLSLSWRCLVLFVEKMLVGWYVVTLYVLDYSNSGVYNILCVLLFTITHTLLI